MENLGKLYILLLLLLTLISRFEACSDCCNCSDEHSDACAHCCITLGILACCACGGVCCGDGVDVDGGWEDNVHPEMQGAVEVAHGHNGHNSDSDHATNGGQLIRGRGMVILPLLLTFVQAFQL